MAELYVECEIESIHIFIYIVSSNSNNILYFTTHQETFMSDFKTVSTSVIVGLVHP